MRTQFLYWLIMCVVCCSCASKRKTVDTFKTEVKSETDLAIQQHKATIVIEHFGAQLNGNFKVADSSKADSSEFESNGIKVKIKVTSNGKGAKVIDFKAEAKPVSRSTSTEEKTNIKLKQKHAERQESKIVNKVKTSPGGWVWLIVVFFIALLVFLIRRVNFF